MIPEQNKRGQVTIFIIFAIIVVVGIIALFYLTSLPTTETNPQKNPQGFMEKCLSEEIAESVEKILPQGGVINPQPFLLFSETDVQFHCYVEAERQRCEILEPMLKAKIEQEIKQDTQAKINRCLNQLEQSFKNYDYSAGPTEYIVEISPNKIKATINKDITIKKDGLTQTFRSFISEQYSPIFDFILISNQIMRKEATCVCGRETCSADIVELSLTNNDYELELFVTGRNEKIYTIRDIKTKLEFNFAVRNCVLLP